MTTTFQYTVRDRSGKLVKGTISAENQTMVMQRLKAGGYAPVSITKASSGIKRELTIPGFGTKVKLKDLSIMARQFATMVNSGLSLLRTLTILSEQTANKELARVLSVVRNEVETGTALSSALGKHPRVFPPIMVNMVRAGEVGGFLDSVMLQLATNFESEVRLRGKVKSAMTYPVVVLGISVVAVIGMLLFIVPVFTKMFKTLGGKLPLPTQILVDISGALKYIALPLIVFVIVAVVMWGKFKHTSQVRNVVDPLKLKLPVFGKLFQQIALSRFTRNLGTMMHSGVPILQSLDIVADTTGNVVVGRVVRDVQDSVRTGEALTAPLSKHPVIPSMVVQMMTVGEETGALDTMLHKISEFYDQEVESTTESLTALIEPLMIAFLGGVIGSMIVALYMPIFKIFSLIS
jgi:type IV pilus assembly protein PilC